MNYVKDGCWNELNIGNVIDPLDNVYQIKNDKVYIFYSNRYKIPDCIGDLEQFKNSHDLRLALIFSGFKFIPDFYKYTNKSNFSCLMCLNCNVKGGAWKLNIYKFPITICKKCYKNTNSKPDYFLPNVEKDKYNNITYPDYVKSYNGFLGYFYSISQKTESVNYIGLLNQHWFNITSDDVCQWCKHHEKYFRSACLQCYNFCLNHFYKTMGIKFSYFRKMCDVVDVQLVVFTLFCQTNGLGICMENFYKENRVVENKVDEKPVSNVIAKEEINSVDLQEFYDRANEIDYEDDTELINYVDSEESG